MVINGVLFPMQSLLAIQGPQFIINELLESLVLKITREVMRYIVCIVDTNHERAYLQDVENPASFVVSAIKSSVTVIAVSGAI